MTDYDADEPVKPMKINNKSSGILTDRLLAGTGVALACAAGLFPWYVFFNEEKFGIRTAGWEHTRDLPEGPGRNVFSVSPLALVDDDKESSPEVRETMVDPVVTATVSQLGEEDKASGQVMPEQPFPGRSGFKLLHVANGRALIEDESGMYMVRVGSILPDNSRVATLEQRDGKWVIITSAGEIYENN